MFSNWILKIGTMDQADRNSNLRNFRNGTIRTLIASDLLGRGVDIHHVQLVINYDIPKEGKVEISKEQYIHRWAAYQRHKVAKFAKLNLLWEF